MAPAEIELLVAALEAEVARLKECLAAPPETKEHGIDEVYGAFANDPDFAEAMRLGRKYRDSLRLKEAKPVKTMRAAKLKAVVGTKKGAKKSRVKQGPSRTIKSRKR